MKRLLLAATLIFASFGAEADVGLPLVPLGYCQLTNLSASIGLSSCANGIPANATLIIFTPSAAAIRYRDDAIAPTATIGQPVAIGTQVTYNTSISGIRFIQQAASGVLDVSFYK